MARFLQHELRNIQARYNGILAPGTNPTVTVWPGDNVIRELTNIAIPLFIVAATTCKFIADLRFGSPQRNIQHFLQRRGQGQGSQLDSAYMPVLYQVVAGLSSRAKEDVISIFKGLSELS
jgi:hypothetical protein